MSRRIQSILWVGAVIALLAGVVVIRLSAQANTPAPVVSNSGLHPSYTLRDINGDNVLESGLALSTMRTCGTCHDTDFIAQHSTHAKQTFEGWNPLTYQTISADTPVSEWLDAVSTRHVGGGLASELVEMNCFLCHTAAPNNDARLAALQSGDPAWANSATLIGSGIVLQDESGAYSYNSDAFAANGSLLREYIGVQDPTAANCGTCHGSVHLDAQIPLTLDECSLTENVTTLTGQVHSPQRLSNTGLNMADKNDLRRTFDVHAERALACTDCHYGQNNPIYYTEDNPPAHLNFDPRRLDFGEYLQRPIHQFAGEPNTTMRTCESCHNMETTHEWLPFKAQHVNALACESCHTPTLYAPALESLDWTALRAPNEPRTTFRAVDNTDCATNESPLITGYQPVLLANDEGKLAPYNLITAWVWVYGDDEQRVPLSALNAAWFDGDAYAPNVLAAFDENTDGALDTHELLLNTDAKTTLITQRLAELGYPNAAIIGEVRPYEIHHNVTNGEWAVKDCATCHAQPSTLDSAFTLSDGVPVGATVRFDRDADGAGIVQQGQTLVLLPAQSLALPPDLYVFGRDNVPLADWVGVLAVLGVAFGVTIHSALRGIAYRRRGSPISHAPRERVYMYSLYERQWHWLQTAAIFILLFTGFVIHKPQMFGIFSFRGIVLVHNVVGFILVINAALAAFYHLASGEIRQYIPKPSGFFYDMFAQMKFYAWGIFRGWPHPFHKSPDHKLNPLQQLTYLAILNILLPAQVITGVLMWALGNNPALESRLINLTNLAPLHTLVAWLFAAFIILHVYLTTTGHSPLANIQSMMLGWDDIENENGASTEETAS